jgi:hypothetical protein
MNKKYTIINSNLNNTDFCIDYFFYIVIFIMIVFLIIQFVILTNYSDKSFIYEESNNNENFDFLQNANNITAEASPVTTLKNSPVVLNDSINKNESTIVTSSENMPKSSNNIIIGGDISIKSPNETQQLTIEQQLQEYKTQNNALKLSKETLEETMKKQARALYLANNYYRVDDSSFNNEVSFINDDFVDIRLPESNFNGKSLITTQQEWNDVLTKANNYKNLYKTGDVVIKPSEYNITKDSICYGEYEKNVLEDPNFKKKYPECMVCSVNPDSDYKNTKSWKNTKTNIHKVCLFNPNVTNETNILNYNGCKKLCGLH